MPKTQPPITLFGYATSPYVMKVKCYLDYKKLDYTFIHVRPKTAAEIAFTGQKKVPVLRIGDEWRVDSAALGHWLDEHFPEAPILGQDQAERDTVLAIDDWVSDFLIPGRFREVLDWDNALNSLQNGWRLARIVHAGTPIPLMWRLLWPVALRKVPFIQDLTREVDRQEPLADMRRRHCREFLSHLGAGPFLGGLAQPSLADLSAFPIFVSSYLLGMRSDYAWLEHPEIINWINRVAEHLPSNPQDLLPMDGRFVTRGLPTSSSV